MFMTLYWLSGVFVFALLIGQIRDIVEAAGQVKDNYRKKMDSALHYMQSINISTSIQDRARQWFLYNWDQSKTIDERSLVAALPKKLQTDLAINVHFNTLSKVQLFQDCERNLLYDLVLKLKPNLFLPGDYVCHKGEVGKEMYIISQGQVEVVGGQNNELVLATLSEGSVFGEISLLAMSGRGNRRTADVRCSGYTNVFTLSKIDFEEAMNEYPEAQKLLKKRAKKLLRENAKKEQQVEAEEIIKTPNETPKLVKTVIQQCYHCQVLKPESETARKLSPSVKRTSVSSDNHHLQVPRPLPIKGPKLPDHSRYSNFAFDFGDEKVTGRPRIRTESYDDDHSDDDILDNGKGLHRHHHHHRQSLPQADINDNDVDALLQSDEDENDDDDDNDPTPEEMKGAEPCHGNTEQPRERSFEEEFFDHIMSELRAQDVIGSGSDTDRRHHSTAQNPVGTSQGSRKTSREEKPDSGSSLQRHERRKSSTADPATAGEATQRKVSRGSVSGAKRKISPGSLGGETATTATHAEGESRIRKLSGRGGRGSGGGDTGGEGGRTSREEGMRISGTGGREDYFGTEEAQGTPVSLDSQDSGLPSMKRSASQSTDKSISGRGDSKESFNSLDLLPSQLPLPPPPLPLPPPPLPLPPPPLPPPPSSLLEGGVGVELKGGRGHVVGSLSDRVLTAGGHYCGGWRGEEETDIDEEMGGGEAPASHHRSSTSSDEDFWPPPPDPVFLETQMGTPPPDSPNEAPPPPITPPASGGPPAPCQQVNGMSSWKISESSSSHPLIIPSQNQVTCAVEVHAAEKRKSPMMIAMTEQVGMTTTTTMTTTSSSSSPSTSTPSKSRPPLPYEIYHMRETIV